MEIKATFQAVVDAINALAEDVNENPGNYKFSERYIAGQLYKWAEEIERTVQPPELNWEAPRGGGCDGV